MNLFGFYLSIKLRIFLKLNLQIFRLLHSFYKFESENIYVYMCLSLVLIYSCYYCWNSI